VEKVIQEITTRTMLFSTEEAQTWMNSARMFSNVYEKIVNAFRCLIRTNIASPPVAMSSCCKQFLGCQACINRWVSENEKCPHCRASSLENIHLYQCFNEVLGEM